MICEHVEELLSAYLDDALAPEEYRAVAAHLAVCPRCSAVLADFRRFDALLSQLPRVSPDAGFCPSLSYSNIRPSVQTDPRLKRRRRVGGQRIMQMMIAATLLLTVGVGGFIALNLRREQTQIAYHRDSITPPAGLQQGPLPAGIRFVFLRDGALWSGSAEGVGQIDRLTPPTVTVAPNWVVQPALAGHSAGDQLAYIDLQQGKPHIIRSDGQSDTPVQQSLLQVGVQPSPVWHSEEGAAILASLAWSKDGSTLVFLADPSGVGKPSLYMYSTNTNSVHMLAPAVQGMILHPVWSPDSTRIAFELIHNGQTSVVDYNVQNNEMLTITPTVSTAEHLDDTVLSLDWLVNADVPTITWSVGTPQHIHSLWIRHVGRVGTAPASMLAIGDYAQAVYSRDFGQKGSWLLLTQSAKQLFLVNINAQVRTLTIGTQISSFSCSPNGLYVDYFDTGALHVLSILHGVDTLLTTNAVDNPMPPVWSVDGQRLLYSTGNQVFSVDILTKTSQALAIKGKDIRAPLLWTQIP